MPTAVAICNRRHRQSSMPSLPVHPDRSRTQPKRRSRTAEVHSSHSRDITRRARTNPECFLAPKTNHSCIIWLRIPNVAVVLPLQSAPRCVLRGGLLGMRATLHIATRRMRMRAILHVPHAIACIRADTPVCSPWRPKRLVGGGLRFGGGHVTPCRNPAVRTVEVPQDEPGPASLQSLRSAGFARLPLDQPRCPPSTHGS